MLVGLTEVVERQKPTRVGRTLLLIFASHSPFALYCFSWPMVYRDRHG